MREQRHQKNLDLFHSLYDKASPSECWPWKGKLDHKGYGRFDRRPFGPRAHRWAFLAAGHLLPNGLELNHTCRNRACVNPNHLQPTTHADIMRRALAHLPKKTHCAQGHPFDHDNTYLNPNSSRRYCRTCMKLATSNWLHRKLTQDPSYQAVSKKNWRASRTSRKRVPRKLKTQGAG